MLRWMRWRIHRKLRPNRSPRAVKFKSTLRRLLTGIWNLSQQGQLQITRVFQAGRLTPRLSPHQLISSPCRHLNHSPSVHHVESTIEVLLDILTLHQRKLIQERRVKASMPRPRQTAPRTRPRVETRWPPRANGNEIGARSLRSKTRHWSGLRRLNSSSNHRLSNSTN